MTEYRARIGEIIIGKKNDLLGAIALGSCVGIVIYDIRLNIAALAHVALPEELFTSHKKTIKNITFPGRYADTAVVECLRLLKKKEKKGVKRTNLKAKIAGGSRMFGTKGLLGGGLNIGDRNIKASIENLKANKIPLEAKDVGGNSSRTIKFDLANFDLKIKKGVKNYKI
ncbi:MAG: Chemoreceptor glutamine deamidase CheD [Candidatus Heimdallarchaeota archaeon LC_2]|nr:MAG: Chemoreceptor glutamine deamidase CheD [Candidatus Heimdallarchaeota archaeon LC_2]